MRRREFIDMILNSISDTFDIYHNYWFEGRKFVIYAYSYNKKDRFLQQMMPSYGTQNAMSICFSLIVIRLA